jgi:hypothetical protein
MKEICWFFGLENITQTKCRMIPEFTLVFSDHLELNVCGACLGFVQQRNSGGSTFFEGCKIIRIKSKED